MKTAIRILALMGAAAFAVAAPAQQSAPPTVSQLRSQVQGLQAENASLRIQIIQVELTLSDLKQSKANAEKASADAEHEAIKKQIVTTYPGFHWDDTTKALVKNEDPKPAATPAAKK